MKILNALPVQRFEVDELADVVVVAGPNGVGKTRLLNRIIQMLSPGESSSEASAIIHMTNDAELTTWGKSTLDLSNPTDSELYRKTIYSEKPLMNWQSSILQFESNRIIQRLQPLQFTWHTPDPAEQLASWDSGFKTWSNRWQETVHSMIRLIESQKRSIAERALQLQREGFQQMDLSFPDPMQPFKDVFAQLLGPKELVEPDVKKQDLEFKTSEGTFQFSSLSSGEKEVANIAFDFLLRRPTDCIVFFDEPELHLHPEFSHRLIQVLQGIGERNQFILSTHSPDVISASLGNSVIFVSPPRMEDGVPANQALAVSEDDETNQALKLLGHSIGIIALGKKIVLIEGEHSSLDKEAYGSLIRGRHPELVLVPSGGKHVIESFGAIQSAVLQKSIWGVEFFMLCDRDSIPPGSPADSSDARFKMLNRYHLENYFLDEIVLAKAFSGMEQADSWLQDPVKIRQRIREIAKSFGSYAVALSVTAEIRRDAGNVSVMPKECHNLSLQEITRRLVEKTSIENSRLTSMLDLQHIQDLAKSYFDTLQNSLDNDDDDWIKLIPGKPVFAKFASKADIHPSRLKTLYLNAAPNTKREPFKDITEIFAHFAAALESPLSRPLAMRRYVAAAASENPTGSPSSLMAFTDSSISPAQRHAFVVRSAMVLATHTRLPARPRSPP